MKKYLTTLSIALVLIGCNNSTDVQQDDSTLAVTRVGDRNISINTPLDENEEAYIYLKNASATRDANSNYLIGYKAKNKEKPTISIDSNVKAGKYKVVAMVPQPDGSYKELDSRVIKIDNVKKSFSIKNIKLDDVYIVNSQSKDNLISTQFYINTNYDTNVTIKAKLNVNGKDYNLKFVDNTKLVDSISDKLTPDTTNGLYVALKLDDNAKEDISNMLNTNDIKDGKITFYISDKYNTIKKDEKISFYKKPIEVTPNTRNYDLDKGKALLEKCNALQDGETLPYKIFKQVVKYITVSSVPWLNAQKIPVVTYEAETIQLTKDECTQKANALIQRGITEEAAKLTKQNFINIGGNKNFPLGNDSININITTNYSSSVNLINAQANSGANFDANLFGYHFSLLGLSLQGIITYASFADTKIVAGLQIGGQNVLSYSKSVTDLTTYKKPQQAELTEEEKKLSPETQAYILRARQAKYNEEAPEQNYLEYDKGFSKNLEIPAFSYTVPVAGIPVHISIAPGGSMGINLNVGLKGITKAQLSISPYGSANVDAQVGVGCDVASAGVEGNVEILNDTVSATGTLAFTFVDKDNALYLKGDVIGDLTNTLTGPNGSLSVYAEVSCCWVTAKKSHEFYSFKSFKNTQNIFHDDKTFVEHKLGDL